jgi:hypothetical protein
LPTERTNDRKVTKKIRSGFATALLLSIALFGPMVAFAGVTVIWPSSETMVDVNTDPPIQFAAGADHARAESLSFSGAFAAQNNDASYTLTVSGLSGGTVIIDELVTVTRTIAVTSYKLEIASALAGTLTTPETLKVRLWTGDIAPTADGDAQVCGVLDLMAALETESAACSAATVKMQLVYGLGADASGSSSVSVRPSSIVFA